LRQHTGRTKRPGPKRSTLASALVTAVLLIVAPAGAGRAAGHTLGSHAKERVLFSFLGFNGAYPFDDVALDAAGNVYGTTEQGGAGGGSAGYGLVFQLSLVRNGRWHESILHRFGGKGDGIFPTSPTMVDAAGNVYGAVANGGALNGGIVYELSPTEQRWKYDIIHAFNGKDGSYPDSALTIDAAGNLYGTTVSGGPGGSAQTIEGAGVVYELQPQPGERWKGRTLYVFNVAQSLNPNSPYAPVLLGADGTLYGTTKSGGVECAKGGSQGCGTAFALTPAHHNKLAVLHDFYESDADGYFPTTGLIADAAGNLYGAVQSGGAQMGGVIYELSPSSGGAWTETILRTFVPGGADGYGPSGLVFDKAGNLYGTQSGGGRYGGGVAFVMRPAPSGTWSYAVIYNFGRNQDASGPVAGSLVFDGAGNLYGATGFGGEDNVGAVYELTP
jgi:hypothetical protein